MRSCGEDGDGQLSVMDGVSVTEQTKKIPLSFVIFMPFYFIPLYLLRRECENVKDEPEHNVVFNVYQLARRKGISEYPRLHVLFRKSAQGNLFHPVTLPSLLKNAELQAGGDSRRSPPSLFTLPFIY